MVIVKNGKFIIIKKLLFRPFFLHNFYIVSFFIVAIYKLSLDQSKAHHSITKQFDFCASKSSSCLVISQQNLSVSFTFFVEKNRFTVFLYQDKTAILNKNVINSFNFKKIKGTHMLLSKSQKVSFLFISVRVMGTMGKKHFIALMMISALLSL